MTVLSPLAEYTLFSSINGTFSRRDYKINHKSLGKYKTEIMSSIFF